MKINDKIIDAMADDIANNLSGVTSTSYTGLDGKRSTKAKMIMEQYLGSNKFLRKHNFLNEYTDIQDDSAKIQKLAQILQSKIDPRYKEIAKQKEEDHFREKFGDIYIPDISVDPYKYIPFIDATNGNKVMVNKDLGKVSKLNFDVWYRLIGPEERKSMNVELRAGLVTFDPYQSKPFETCIFEGQEVIKLNLYNPPKWMQNKDGIVHLLDADEIEQLECPEPIMKFMKHLFPEDDCREFVFNWMHYALTRRCETYLTLNGKKGVGKGIFCNQIMQCLVGEDNYLIAPESILDSIFNSALENTRLLVLDEVRVDNDKQLNKLKKYANNKQNIEKKGIDANNVVETFSSNIISNNDIMDMRLTWDERRFSIPELNNTPLLEVWDQKEIDGFIKSFTTDKKMVRDFGYWIFYKAKSKYYHEFSTWKGDRFNSIVYHSLAEWKKVIVDLVLADKNEESVWIKDCKKEYKNRVDNGKFPVKPRRIEEFLEDYRHKGFLKLGSLKFDKEEKDYEILKSDELIEKRSKRVIDEPNDDTTYGLL